MSDASDVWKNAILESTYRGAAYVVPTGIEVAVSTTTINDDGTGLTEPVGNNYARAAVVYDAAALGIVLNQLVTFNQASGSWGTLTDFALFNAGGAGEMLSHDQLTAPVPIANLETLRFQPGQLPVSLQ